MAGKPLDRTGVQYGELTAIRILSGTRNGNSRVWLFECSCGNTREAAPSDLIAAIKKGSTPRCLECNPSKELPIGMANRNLVLGNYRRHARDRGYTFDLSDEEVSILFSSPCFYCGDQPSNVMSRRKNNGPFVYNGIDRFDNSKGYSKENCVSCCSQCNRSKSDLGLEEFIAWIHRASEHLWHRED